MPDISEASPIGRDDLLVQLRRDQQRCWQQGRRVLLESYLPQHPGLLADEGLLLDLLYGEVLLREEFGERPDLEEYLRRFPQYENQLRRQFVVHQAMETAGGERSDDYAGGGETTLTRLAGPCHRPPAEATTDGAVSQVGSSAGQAMRVAGYEILREVGRGGMGVVYQARQLSLNRVVALKMILASVHASPQAAARFRAEAEAVAMLQHPNIVQIYEVGEHEGQPFLALEFVDGVSLAQHIRGTPQSPRRAAKLVALLAHAVHAAHRQGIVHRDLKPANVLLAPSDRHAVAGRRAGAVGRVAQSDPSWEAEPKITDFGLAKRLGSDSRLTQTGDVLGTPSYMAPEQASGRTRELGPLVDVYALGAILYELLTGRPPFRGADALDTLEQVRFHEPLPPRRLQPKIPGDLETICLKCLQKPPARRYPSAESLALDLERFGAGKPIQARRISAGERCWKWAKRRPTAAALIAVTLIAAFGLLAVWARLTSKLQVERDLARHERREAILQKGIAAAERDRAEQLLHDAQINLAQQAWLDADIPRLSELLQTRVPAPGRRDFRGPEWYYLQRLCHSDLLTLRGHSGSVRHVAFSPDGRLLASAGDDEVVKVWEAATGKELYTLREHASYTSAVAFGPDSQWLATASGDHTVRIWDANNGERLRTLRGHLASVYGVAFSPDGRRLATASGDRTVRVWDAATGELLQTREGHAAAVHAVAFSPNGRQIASASRDGTVLLWDTERSSPDFFLRGSGGMAAPPTDPSAGPRSIPSGDSDTAPAPDLSQPEGNSHSPTGAVVRGLAYSPDGHCLAAGGENNAITIWDPVNGQVLRTLRGHTGEVTGVDFSPDGRVLASSSWDKTVRVWDVTSGRQELILRGHTGLVLAVAYHPDGRRLASASREVKIWDALQDQDSRPLRGHQGAVHCVAIHPGSRLLASAGQEGAVRIWDVATGDQQDLIRHHSGPVMGVTFSADGRLVASGGQDRSVGIWPLGHPAQAIMLRGHTDTVNCVAFSPDGRLLASASRDHTVRLWDVASRKATRTLRGHAGFVQAVTFSSDGRQLASCARDGTVMIWDAANGQLTRELAGHAGAVGAVAFSPDSSTLASSGEDNVGNVIKIWNPASGELVRILSGHSQAVRGIAFDPSGTRLVTCSGSLGRPGELKLWDLVTGQELLTLSGHAHEITSVAVSGDGQFWASAGRDEVIRIWDAPCPPGRNITLDHRSPSDPSEAASKQVLLPDFRCPQGADP